MRENEVGVQSIFSACRRPMQGNCASKLSLSEWIIFIIFFLILNFRGRIQIQRWLSAWYLNYKAHFNLSSIPLTCIIIVSQIWAQIISVSVDREPSRAEQSKLVRYDRNRVSWEFNCKYSKRRLKLIYVQYGSSRGQCHCVRQHKRANAFFRLSICLMESV